MIKGLKELYPYFLGGKPVTLSTQKSLPVVHKFTQKVVSHVSLADEQAIKAAIEKGVQAEESMKQLPSFQRKDILLSIASQIKEREEELANVLAVEVGKTLKEAKIEVGRAVDTFTISAEESVRRGGEFSLMDCTVRNKGFQGITSKFPVGLVSMIVPFNFPLNLAAHKVGPAIAAGCPFLLKPSDRTPISASILGEILAKSGLPEGSFSILPCLTEDAKFLSVDDRVKLLSFTGSVAIGWKLKADAGKKKVTLELGGNAACIIDEDATDIEHITDRLSFGAFYQAGQSCISVQRVFIHEKLYDAIKVKFIEKTKKLKKGDPFDPETFVGPVISPNDALRIEKWVNDAVQGGGKILVGGTRDGVLYDPTIVENAPKESFLHCQEVFGPVCVIEKFSNFKDAVKMVNDSSFGLQAGVFTQNINKAFYAFNNLHVGGVLINDIPSARVDSQPYGGIKDSGLGREGIKYAIEDFSEVKIMLLKDIGNL